ncbi:MAG TPA: HlyD family secretion protein [Tepidisphaeraceae bacterium]|nr:HlyD family secretion protein [Tepidisphaeraceae bacterium]
MSTVEQTVRRPSAVPAPRPTPSVSEPPKRLLRRFVSLMILVLAIGVGLTVAAKYYLDSLQYQSTDDAFIDGHIVTISPQVSARVLNVLVNDNQPVKQGDVLVQLDPTDYQVVLDQTKATEASMVSRVAEARTQLDVKKADVGEAEAELNVALTNATNMDKDYNRFAGLDPRARSQQQFDNATAAMRSSAATVQQARAKLAGAQAQVVDATAAVQTAIADAAKASADTRQAATQLGYCTITAPQDGIVTRKTIESGMYLTLGQPIMSIVPTDVWVTANYKETQLDQIHPGQATTIYIDAYPEQVFHGTVDSIQYGTGSKFTLLPPENATGNFVKVVQRVPVKIVFDPGELAKFNRPLALGMSVEPYVTVQQRPTIWMALGLVSGKTSSP